MLLSNIFQHNKAMEIFTHVSEKSLFCPLLTYVNEGGVRGALLILN